MSTSIRRRQWVPPPRCQHCGEYIKKTKLRGGARVKTMSYCGRDCYNAANVKEVKCN
jgi:hypothetical protein